MLSSYNIREGKAGRKREDKWLLKEDKTMVFNFDLKSDISNP